MGVQAAAQQRLSSRQHLEQLCSEHTNRLLTIPEPGPTGIGYSYPDETHTTSKQLFDSAKCEEAEGADCK